MASVSSLPLNTQVYSKPLNPTRQTNSTVIPAKPLQGSLPTNNSSVLDSLSTANQLLDKAIAQFQKTPQQLMALQGNYSYSECQVSSYSFESNGAEQAHSQQTQQQESGLSSGNLDYQESIQQNSVTGSTQIRQQVTQGHRVILELAKTISPNGVIESITLKQSGSQQSLDKSAEATQTLEKKFQQLGQLKQNQLSALISRSPFPSFSI